MATEIIMPQMGFDMTQGKVVRWVKKEGEQVTRGETVAEIETEKVVLEVEAFASGTLRRILVPEGETVPVGQVVALLGEPDEDLSAWEARPPVITAAPPPAVETPVEEAVAAPTERLRISPIARRIAGERGLDLRQVKGTGPGGRIVKEDVLARLAQPEEVAAPARAIPKVAPPSRMRQAIARLMAQSKREIPHFYLTVEIDMTEAQRLRKGLNEVFQDDRRITLNDLAVKAVALALERFPQLNSFYLPEGIKQNEKINIGVAVALEEGLVAPALLDCAEKTLQQIAVESKSLVERARSGVLKLEEFAGATFTLSNLGMLGVDSFQAIINPPQAAILALGSVKSEPVVRDGEVTIAEMMNATLSADHRVTDGAQASQFMKEFKALLENPLRLLL